MRWVPGERLVAAGGDGAGSGEAQQHLWWPRQSAATRALGAEVRCSSEGETRAKPCGRWARRLVGCLLDAKAWWLDCKEGAYRQPTGAALRQAGQAGGKHGGTWALGVHRRFARGMPSGASRTRGPVGNQGNDSTTSRGWAQPGEEQEGSSRK